MPQIDSYTPLSHHPGPGREHKAEVSSTMKNSIITDPRTREQIATRTSLVGIVGNVLLTVFKLFAGVAAGSSAMVSDAVHSASDVFATFVVMVGVKMGSKAPDKEHPYGHERFECLAALAVALLLFAAGGAIGWAGLQTILFRDSADIVPPGALALVAAGVSIAVKEAMYHYTIRAARHIDSAALRASAWDHRSDAFSSIGSFAGILGARCGFPKLDAVAGVVICVCILKVGYGILKEAIDKMVDHACSDEVEDAMRTSIQSVDGTLRLDQLRTREFGDKYYVDVEISLPGSITLEQAHTTAHIVHDTIERTFPKVKHCMVHVNPSVD